MRARYPDVDGPRRPRRRHARLRGVRRPRRDATDRRSCCCRPGRSSTPGSGRCRCRTSPATSTSSSTTGPATATSDRSHRSGPLHAPVLRRRRSRGARRVRRRARRRRRTVARCVVRGRARRAATRRDRRSRPDRLGPPARARAAAAGRHRRALPRSGARSTRSGWDRYNLAYWHAHYDEFARWFFEQVFSEPHSTKGLEDAVGVGDGDRRRACSKPRRCSRRPRDRSPICSPNSAARRWSSTGRDDRISVPRHRRRGGPAVERHARVVRRVRSHAQPARPGPVQPRCCASSSNGWRR